MAKIVLPEDPEIASKIIDVEDRHRQRIWDVGLMGYFFGKTVEKPGNIAGFSIIFFGVMLTLVLIFGSDTTTMTKRDMVTVIAGFITLTLGFIFGHTTSGKGGEG